MSSHASSRYLSLNDAAPNRGGDVVVYVMNRDQRLHDNHALLYAQEMAHEYGVGLVIACQITPLMGYATREQAGFMIDGLNDLEKWAHEYGIGFDIIPGDTPEEVVTYCQKKQAAHIVFDFSPLKMVREWQKAVAATCGVRTDVVDTHNIIPAWLVSDKEEYGARTLRIKMVKQLEQWLVEPKRLVKHQPEYRSSHVQWRQVKANVMSMPSSGVEITRASGEVIAREHLEMFLEYRLARYASDRNDPTKEGQSGLSPYFHYGMVSPLRAALEVTKVSPEIPLLFREARMAQYDGEPSLQDSIDVFLEELIVRRELADNYCFYNDKYESLDGIKPWARATLEAHRGDVRDFIYTCEEWERADTHDAAWNACQKQLVRTGQMHGYMRMYWGKKLLEWSSSPEDALKTAIYLNDTYALDGVDANGYVGILWCIGGVHDRPWFDRAVYGTIRYMNASGLKKKFDIDAYISRWS